MKLSVFQLSRRGGRERNEDRMGYCCAREACLVLLADGMGGHADGHVAAQIALQSIFALFQARATPQIADAPAFLAEALLHAHQQILRHARQLHMVEAPRTTLVAALLQREQLHWIHCGDSRLYLMREGTLLARTRDHSFREMAERAEQPQAQANRNLLFTCLGAPTAPIFDQAGPHRLDAGDRLLLCSDGLWDPVSDAELLQVLAHDPVSLGVPRLVATALQRAGANSDNVTAIALEWEMPSVATAPEDFFTDALGSELFQSPLRFDLPGAPVPAAPEPAAPEPAAPEPAAPEDELSEAAIERTIAEINAAIRRPSERRH